MIDLVKSAKSILLLEEHPEIVSFKIVLGADSNFNPIVNRNGTLLSGLRALHAHLAIRISEYLKRVTIHSYSEQKPK